MAQAPHRGTHRGWGVVAAVLLLAAGGASSYGTLLADREVPEFARLCDRAASLPGQVERVVASAADGDVPPLRLVVEERGSGAPDRVVVLVHGVVSDRRTWRFVAGDLGRDHRLLLVDLPGCGESDCPEPGLRGKDDYCPTALARYLLTVLRDRMSRYPSGTKLTLAGHSLGGSVIFRMLGDPALRDEFADVRARIDGAVLFAPADFGMVTPPPALRQIATMSALEVTLGGLLGVVHDMLAERYAAEAPEPDIPLKEEVDRTVECLAPGERLDATQALIRQALPFRDDGIPDWERTERLVADYANFDVPCLIAWGARDATLPVAMGHKLAAELPRARLVVVPRSTHSLPTERPAVCSELIRRFVAGDEPVLLAPAGSVLAAEARP